MALDGVVQSRPNPLLDVLTHDPAAVCVVSMHIDHAQVAAGPLTLAVDVDSSARAPRVWLDVDDFKRINGLKRLRTPAANSKEFDARRSILDIGGTPHLVMPLSVCQAWLAQRTDDVTSRQSVLSTIEAQLLSTTDIWEAPVPHENITGEAPRPACVFKVVRWSATEETKRRHTATKRKRTEVALDTTPAEVHVDESSLASMPEDVHATLEEVVDGTASLSGDVAALDGAAAVVDGDTAEAEAAAVAQQSDDINDTALVFAVQKPLGVSNVVRAADLDALLSAEPMPVRQRVGATA